MIKPVYFGKKDGKLIEYVDKINFSEWVREKLREELANHNIGIVENENNRIDRVDIDSKDIELLIRKIIKEEKEENMISSGDEKVYIETEIEMKEIENVEDREEDIQISGWTL